MTCDDPNIEITISKCVDAQSQYSPFTPHFLFAWDRLGINKQLCRTFLTNKRKALILGQSHDGTLINSTNHRCPVTHLAFTEKIHVASMFVVFLSHDCVGSHGVLHYSSIFVSFLSQLYGKFSRRLRCLFGFEAISHLRIIAFFIVHHTSCL